MTTDKIVKDVMTENPVTARPDTSLREAVALMRDSRIRHLPVVEDGGRLVGMLTDRDVRHAALVPALAEHLPWELRRLKTLRVRDVMTWSVVSTHTGATIAQAGVTMVQRRIGSLPVVDNGQLVGILTATDVLGALDRVGEDRFDGLPGGQRGGRERKLVMARDVMTVNPATVTSKSTVAEVWDLMRELHVRHMPVVEDGGLVGMLSDRDLAYLDVARVLADEGADALRRSLATPIVTIMRPDVIFIDPETDVSDVVELMIENNVGAIPVVRGETREVVGIISYIDALRALQDLLQGV